MLIFNSPPLLILHPVRFYTLTYLYKPMHKICSISRSYVFSWISQTTPCWNRNHHILPPSPPLSILPILATISSFSMDYSSCAKAVSFTIKEIWLFYRFILMLVHHTPSICRYFLALSHIIWPFYGCNTKLFYFSPYFFALFGWPLRLLFFWIKLNIFCISLTFHRFCPIRLQYQSFSIVQNIMNLLILIKQTIFMN